MDNIRKVLLWSISGVLKFPQQRRTGQHQKGSCMEPILSVEVPLTEMHGQHQEGSPMEHILSVEVPLTEMHWTTSEKFSYGAYPEY